MVHCEDPEQRDAYFPQGLSGCQRRNHELWFGRMFVTGGDDAQRDDRRDAMRALQCCLADTTGTGPPLMRTYDNWICPASIEVDRFHGYEYERRMTVGRDPGLGDKNFGKTGEAWHTDRVDARARLRLDGMFRPDDSTQLPSNRTMHLFVIDTGIYPEHSAFENMAIEMLYPDPQGARDCDGHGTHVASTAASSFGVVRGPDLDNVIVYSARVLDCSGSGSTFGVVAGMSAVSARIGELQSMGRQDDLFIVSMSLGGTQSQLVDDLVDGITTSQGAPVVVSAGNSAGDACTRSPSGAPLAITVGATDDDDRLASFSNFGSCVDIYAPGVDVEAAVGTGSDLGSLSGTSMSTPIVSAAMYYVAGRDALCRNEDGDGPGQLVGATGLPNVARCLLSHASRGLVSGISSNNRLVYIGDDIDNVSASLKTATVSYTLLVLVVTYFLLNL